MTVPAASDAEELVECVAAARTFGAGPAAVVAVHGISCVVPRGARIALSGPSGSGKSTLLHLMAGLDAPTTGEVRWPAWPGSPVGRPDAVGLVFQGPSLMPSLDVTENVALPLLFAGVRDAAALDRAHAALDRLGIDGLGRMLPGEISAGQAQRVAVARVLAAGPQLILADEPTGRLDHEAAERVIRVLLEAADELGAAVVVATHDPVVAQRLDRHWWMDDGRLRTRPGHAGAGSRGVPS